MCYDAANKNIQHQLVHSTVYGEDTQCQLKSGHYLKLYTP